MHAMIRTAKQMFIDPDQIRPARDAANDVLNDDIAVPVPICA